MIIVVWVSFSSTTDSSTEYVMQQYSSSTCSGSCRQVIIPATEGHFERLLSLHGIQKYMKNQLLLYQHIIPLFVVCIVQYYHSINASHYTIPHDTIRYSYNIRTGIDIASHDVYSLVLTASFLWVNGRYLRPRNRSDLCSAPSNKMSNVGAADLIETANTFSGTYSYLLRSIINSAGCSTVKPVSSRSSKFHTSMRVVMQHIIFTPYFTR